MSERAGGQTGEPCVAGSPRPPLPGLRAPRAAAVAVSCPGPSRSGPRGAESSDVSSGFPTPGLPHPSGLLERAPEEWEPGPRRRDLGRREDLGCELRRKSSPPFGLAFMYGETEARAAGRLPTAGLASRALGCNISHRAMGCIDGSVLGCLWLPSRKSSLGSGLVNAVFCFFFHLPPFPGSGWLLQNLEFSCKVHSVETKYAFFSFIFVCTICGETPMC